MKRRPGIEEAAAEANLTHWTIRRYLKRGVIKGRKGPYGDWELEPNAAKKAREHYRKHGGPGGRAVKQV